MNARNFPIVWATALVCGCPQGLFSDEKWLLCRKHRSRWSTDQRIKAES